MKKSQNVSRITRGASPVSSNRAASASRQKLLQSAEELFSSKEFRDVSIRELAKHAGVNSALVGYYFRGKQALFDEVYCAHQDRLSNELVKQLKAIGQNGRKPSLEKILTAWILPWLQLGDNPQTNAIHLRITTNLFDKGRKQTRSKSTRMRQVHDAYIEALHACLPDLSPEAVIWRLHFVLGALIFGVRQPGPLMAISGGRCDPNDLNETVRQILPYAIAGFLAPDSCNNSDQKADRLPAKRVKQA